MSGCQASPVTFLNNSTNELFVFGTITCTKKAQGGVRAVVTQGTVERAGELSFPCTGKPTTWLITLPDDSLGQYTSGPATLAIGFSATRGSDGVETGHEEAHLHHRVPAAPIPHLPQHGLPAFMAHNVAGTPARV